MTNNKDPAKPTLLFPRTSKPLAPSLTTPAAPGTLSGPELSSASCKSVSAFCISFSAPSLLAVPYTSAPFRPSVTIPTISHTLPGREPTSASRILLSAFVEALYYSGVSDCVPCPVAFRIRVPSIEHWRPQHQACIRDLFGVCLEPPEGIGDLDMGLSSSAMVSDAEWSSVEAEIFEQGYGDLSLDEQLTCLRRLYDLPEGLEARKRRHVGRRDAIAALVAAVMGEL
ncbi:hypothetical protein MMC30_004750 [Trapelia coarctata]|nr:hypothetical protein [Trapelia coarctata]